MHVWETARSVNGPLYKRGDLSLDSQGPHTRWPRWSVPPTPVPERQRDRWILGISEPATLSESETSGFSDRFYLQKLRQWLRKKPDVESRLQRHVQTAPHYPQPIEKLIFRSNPQSWLRTGLPRTRCVLWESREVSDVTGQALTIGSQPQLNEPINWLQVWTWEIPFRLSTFYQEVPTLWSWQPGQQGTSATLPLASKIYDPVHLVASFSWLAGQLPR